MQAGEGQPGGFVETQHAVHGLHAVPGAAFDEIIQGAKDDHAAAVRVAFKADVAEIGAAENFRFRVAVRPLFFLHEAHWSR